MAGSPATKEKTKKKANKRKSTNLEYPRKTSRKARKRDEKRETPSNSIMEVEKQTTLEIDEFHQWRTLELVLSIQSKDISAHKKVELVYEFAKSRAYNKDNDTKQEFNILSMPQTIVYISGWIQSILFMSERKIRDGDNESEESRLCLDHKCWEILKFCLEESSRLHVSLSLSRDILKVISCVAIFALNLIKSVCTDNINSIFSAMESHLYSSVRDCIILLFSSHGRLLNENLDSWAGTVYSVLELVIKIYEDNLQDSGVGISMSQFSCLVLELFIKFLKVHPCRKNGFRDFVDKLLEPLLHLLGLICHQNFLKCQNLFKLAEEILSYGLFHSVLLDEYLSFHSTEKYSSSADGKLENGRTTIKSFHRHLFDKLEIFISEKKVHTLSGTGVMFNLFVDCMKKYKRNSLTEESSKLMESQSTKHLTKLGTLTSEKGDHKNAAGSDMRKSVFDFFVLIMEPLLLDLDKHVQSAFQSRSFLLDFFYDLKYISKILSIMSRESIYVKMEGDFTGARHNFLKIIFDLLLSCYDKFNTLWQSNSCMDSFQPIEIFNLAAKEFILVISSFLEIEYELVGDYLVETWLMIVTFLEMAHSSENASLLSETIDVGCRVLDLYSELRQVNQAVFTLCRGLRHLAFYQGDAKMRHPESITINYYEKFSLSGRLLLCSQKFRLAIIDAIKSIPEGQVSGCVQTLRDDISESLAWMKVGYLVTDEYESRDATSCKFTAQAEVFGLVLSEIYFLVLDSLFITAGNSYLTGVSLNNLVELLRPSASHLVFFEQDRVNDFLFSVTGITYQTNMVEHKKYCQSKIPLIALFFFRLYVSCRSLYRQALSHMPPGSSRKMSVAMADFYTSYSGQDCMREDFEEGYFSWIDRDSASLLCVVQFIKENFLQQGSVDYSCLIYVLFIMAFQRLVDLNRRVKSLEYIEQRSKIVTHGQLMDEADSLVLRDNQKKLRRNLSCLKQEAIGLTGFIMDYLSSTEEQLLSKLSGRITQTSLQDLEFDTWDLGICTVNKKTLPTAIWWIICQNVDTWCDHATKKKLKLFLKLLVLSSLPNGRCGEFRKHTWNACKGMSVNRQQISQQQLHDTTLYDLRSVRRYMASVLCNILKKCVSLLFKDSSGIDAELSSTDWEKVLCALNNSSMSPKAKRITSCTCSPMIEDCCNEQTSYSSISLPVAACKRLLVLLCHMRESSFNSKSFARCMTYLVNCERNVLERLMDPQGKLCLHQTHELVGLLASCRKSLKYLLMAFCEKSEANKSLSLQIFSGSSFPTLWLLKSVSLVFDCLSTSSSRSDGGQVYDIIFSLMNQTSYVFQTFCKCQFGLAMQSVWVSNKCMKSSKDVEVGESLVNIIMTMEDQTKSCLLLLKEAFNGGNMEIGVQLTYMNKLCSVICCVQGFMWGLVSTLNDVGASGYNLNTKMLKRKYKAISGISKLVEQILEFIGVSSQIFLYTDQPLKHSFETKEQLECDHNIDALGTGLSMKKDLGGKEADNVETCNGCLIDFGLFNFNCLRIELLQSFFSGQNLEAAFLLRGLFTASSAILRLSAQIGCCSLPSNLVQILLGCSEVLIMKFSGLIDIPKQLSFVWLDGSLNFLEALGSQFSPTNHASTSDVYTKLMKLHLKAIGKCISLQGKGATLVSHDIESSTKFSDEQVSESPVSCILYCLDKLKARLRMSFRVFIEKPSELHLSSAVQAVQGALVGIQEGCIPIYDVKMESVDGGTVSSMVAAGVDCLDLILEFVKGQKKMDVISKNINSLFASLINIIVHLQGPILFYRKPNNVAVSMNPDSGSVVVMCVEVLTRVAGKPAMFSLDSCNIAQSLHIPAKLFQNFCYLREGESFHPSLLRFEVSQESDLLESCFFVDRQFSINLYAASCRLLWTVVKYHKSNCVRCVSLLQYSLQALLHCLEIVNVDSTGRKGRFTWQVEEGVKCASYLRRIYEEIRQQKDVLGRHCFMFLSDYIWLYSGHSSIKRGIKREVDEALRPGVYALIDVCSTDDLQYLHTVFGEGPCRSTLASLQHDYKLHFQYEGKV